MLSTTTLIDLNQRWDRTTVAVEVFAPVFGVRRGENIRVGERLIELYLHAIRAHVPVILGRIRSTQPQL